MKQIAVDFRNNLREDNQGIAETRSRADQAKLVRQAAEGSYEAFGRLYRLHVEAIYRYVFYQVRDRMTAEDITEEVFLKAMGAIASCRGKETTFSSWLYRIAHNQVVDRFRSARQRLTLDSAEVSDLADPAQEPGKNVERQALLEAMAQLPQNQKQVIIMKFIQGLDNREIGQNMRKSEGAIRILQMRGLAALRRTLGNRI